MPKVRNLADCKNALSYAPTRRRCADRFETSSRWCQSRRGVNSGSTFEGTFVSISVQRTYGCTSEVRKYFRTSGSTEVRKYESTSKIEYFRKYTCTTKLYFRTTLLYFRKYESTTYSTLYTCTVQRCTSVSKILSIKINNFNTTCTCTTLYSCTRVALQRCTCTCTCTAVHVRKTYGSILARKYGSKLLLSYLRIQLLCMYHHI